MALPILDGNQSATTLSTILSSGQHITAHTVVSLGTQAITDISGAVSGSVISISNLPATQPVSISSVTIGNTVTISGTVTANPTGTQTIAGTVTANNLSQDVYDVANDWRLTRSALHLSIGAGEWQEVGGSNGSENPLPISGTVTANPTGTQMIVGSVTLGAGTAQIGSVTASISGTVPVSGTFFQGTQPVSLTTLPALVAGTAQIGSVTASISNSVTIGSLPVIAGTVTANVPVLDQSIRDGILLFNQTEGNIGVAVNYAEPITGTVTANTFAVQGTAVTTSNFTSTTASTVLANYNATREVLTIFNEGAGNLYICAGATCTTIAYQVRLSAGDYYEVPNHQTTITHSAVFATAGTARVVQVS